MEDVMRLDAMAQADLVRRGEVTPRELVEAAIARIEKTNPSLNAVILPAFERARDLAIAQQAEAKRGERSFLGVPFLMKDIGGQEAGAPCHMGMKCLKRA